MIETESGRGESYANPQEYPEINGYDVYPLRDNFSPKEYGEAIDAIQKAGYDALIVDSASHEWESVGGVLDMAAKNQAAGKKGPIVWQQPKIDHQKHFMLKFMQTPISLVILNMRAKYVMIESMKDGKKEWVRDKDLSPKQSEDILFEMFVHGWIDKGHAFHPTKITGKGLQAVFKDGEKISVETGQRLAEWAKGAPTHGAEITHVIALPPVEETPEQKIKKLAGTLMRGIQNCKDLGDIDGFMHEYATDFDEVKSASQAAYDHVMKEKALKIASLEAK